MTDERRHRVEFQPTSGGTTFAFCLDDGFEAEGGLEEVSELVREHTTPRKRQRVREARGGWRFL